MNPGPYNTETEVLQSPLCQEIRNLHDANRVKSGDPDRLVRRAAMRHLTKACTDAGVTLGAFDAQTLVWLCGLEEQTVQVIIGLIARAHTAGQASRQK